MEVGGQQEDTLVQESEHVPVARTPQLPLAIIASKPEIEEGEFEVLIEDEFEVEAVDHTNNKGNVPQSSQHQSKHNIKSNGLKAEKQKKVEEIAVQNYASQELVAEIARPIKTGPTSEQISKKLREIKKTISFTNSIIEPVQTLELKNHMIGKLARVFCMYRVNEIFVYNDEAFARDKRASGFDPSEFIVKILQYLETPQYLRKKLFPISALLRNVGLLTPLECQHHLKVTDISEYREGVVLKRPTRENEGSWVDVGLLRVS